MRAPTSPFVVHVPEIPPEGLQRAFDLGGAFLENALKDTEAQAASSSARATLDLSRTGHDVLVRGDLTGALVVVCSRCAGPANVTLEEHLDLLYVPRGKDTDLAEPEANASEPDLLPYDGDTIDLAEMLREELLLALPLAPLCKDTCAGLCPRCGADLNQGPHECTHEPTDDRWAALRNLKV